ncbi:MAG: hypothetical protein CM1200mP2_03460 [Planctomycetaceae bacterium]|nr:MAG: hypothetical protein CM1200mP2_03460 [Planctomycetaceae bacterium]
MLDETLVIWNSEFGRTPKINKNAGRDHWGPCNSVVMAGGGVPGGQVFGPPTNRPLTPPPKKSPRTTSRQRFITCWARGRDPGPRSTQPPSRDRPGEPIHKLLGGHCRVEPTRDPTPRIHVTSIGPFETMLKENGNRFLCLEPGNADNETHWAIKGLAQPSTGKTGRSLGDAAATLAYKGIFWNHFDYTNVLIRWPAPQRSRAFRSPLPANRCRSPRPRLRRTNRIWQIPIPQGLVPSIPNGRENWSFH